MLKTTSPIRKNGFFVTYVLFGIALISMIGGMIGFIYKSNLQSQSRSQLKEQLQSDAMFIVQQIVNCVVQSPGGNNGDTNSFDLRFPAQRSDNTIGDLNCPTPEASDTPTSLWNSRSTSVGTYRLTPPPARPGYSEWKYQNKTDSRGASGVRLYIEVSNMQSSNSSDAIALLNSFRMRKDVSDYFPDPVVTPGSPATLYSINLSQ